MYLPTENSISNPSLDWVEFLWQCAFVELAYIGCVCHNGDPVGADVVETPILSPSDVPQRSFC